MTPVVLDFGRNRGGLANESSRSFEVNIVREKDSGAFLMLERDTQLDHSQVVQPANASNIQRKAKRQ
jgi:hypothetical protein